MTESIRPWSYQMVQTTTYPSKTQNIWSFYITRSCNHYPFVNMNKFLIITSKWQFLQQQMHHIITNYTYGLYMVTLPWFQVTNMSQPWVSASPWSLHSSLINSAFSAVYICTNITYFTLKNTELYFAVITKTCSKCSLVNSCHATDIRIIFSHTLIILLQLNQQALGNGLSEK